MKRDEGPSRRALLTGAIAVPAAAALASVPSGASASTADWEAALAAYDRELNGGEAQCAPLAPTSCLDDGRPYDEQWAPYLAARRAHGERKAEALRRLMLTPAPDFEALVVKQSLAFKEYCCREDGDVRRALAADLARLSRGG